MNKLINIINIISSKLLTLRPRILFMNKYLNDGLRCIMNLNIRDTFESQIVLTLYFPQLYLNLVTLLTS